MKVYKISNKTVIVRHWFRWYRVLRGGTDWHKLEVKKRIPPISIKQISKNLQKMYPSQPISDILSEEKADREVAKVLRKNRAQKKGRG